MTKRAAHWDRVFSTKPSSQTSWYQAKPEPSLRIIRELAPPPARVIDVGAGDGRLIDELLDAGYPSPIALDVSAEALERVRQRLGDRATLATWIVADITRTPELPVVDLWHDRAALHFLGAPDEREAYATLVRKSVDSGGHAVIATFAPDGPSRCSGLDVTRHDARSVHALLGEAFVLVEEERETHVTPSGTEQRFCWTVLRRR